MTTEKLESCDQAMQTLSYLERDLDSIESGEPLLLSDRDVWYVSRLVEHCGPRVLTRFIRQAVVEAQLRLNRELDRE